VTGRPTIVPRTSARVIFLDERACVLLFKGRISSTAVGDITA
jgi:hypothetical protein